MSEITPEQRARRVLHGGAAVRAGTPDYGQNGNDGAGRATDAGDAIANVLHWLRDAGGADEDIERALRMAFDHYAAEAL